MTVLKSKSVKSHLSGFTLIDIIIASLIGAIVLIGAYKVFMSSVETTTQSLDMASLDTKGS